MPCSVATIKITGNPRVLPAGTEDPSLPVHPADHGPPDGRLRRRYRLTFRLPDLRHFSMTWQMWLAFLGASIAISVSPGPGRCSRWPPGLTPRRPPRLVERVGAADRTDAATGAGGRRVWVPSSPASVLAFPMVKWLGCGLSGVPGGPAVAQRSRDLRARLGGTVEQQPAGAGDARLPGEHHQSEGPGVPARRRCRSSWCRRAPLLPQYLAIGATMIVGRHRGDGPLHRAGRHGC